MVFIKKPEKPKKPGEKTLTSKERKKEGLPEKIPDLLKEVDEKVSEEEETKEKMEALLKDIDINIAIGNIELAKKYYRQILGYYTKLPNEKKKEYYERIMNAYKEIKKKKTNILKKLFSKK